jgi:hypothetical protein
VEVTVNHLSPEDRGLLDRARDGHEPTGADRARVRAALAAQIGLGASLVSTSAGAGSTALASSSFAGIAIKIAVTVAVVGGLTGAGALAYHRSARPAGVAPVVQTSSTPKPAQAMVVSRPAGPAAPPTEMARLSPLPESVADNATPPPVGDPRTASPGVPAFPPATAILPARRNPDMPSLPITNGAKATAVSAREAPPVSGPVDAVPSRTSDTPAPPADSAIPAPPPPPLPPTTLERETRLVGAAVTALHAGDAARALVLLDEHARQFPEGALAQERIAERITALCMLGRRDEARAAAGAFLRGHGGSPLVDRVRASCGAPDTIP